MSTDDETTISVHFPRSESDSKRSNGSQGGGEPQWKANLMDVEPDDDMIGEIADNEVRTLSPPCISGNALNTTPANLAFLGGGIGIVGDLSRCQ